MTEFVQAVDACAVKLDVDLVWLHQDMRTWWVPGTQRCLTKSAFEYITAVLKVPHACFSLQKPLTSRQLINLVSFCQEPYYIANKKLCVFGTREQMFLSLNDCNLDHLR
jgi:hypothetical protein